MTSSRKKATLTALLAVLLLALAWGSASATAQTKRQPLYWGAWIGDQITGEQPPWDMGGVSHLQGTVGKGLSLIEFASPFAKCEQSCSFYRFPTDAMQAVRNYGAIPFFSWSSTGNGEPRDPSFRLATVARGDYDSYIRSFATEAREWGHPFFLRFNWEMNGRWFPWAERANANKRGQYVAAWRHVHDIFSSVGATNVTWTWCPYAYQPGLSPPLRRFYPGNRYVDWTCLDGFNWGRNSVNPGPWKTFRKVFSHAYDEITKRVAPTKPMVVAEMGTNGGAKARARWVSQMFKALPRRFPAIRGLIWYDQSDRGVRWPLEIFPKVSASFARGLRSTSFQSNRFGQIDASPIAPPE